MLFVEVKKQKKVKILCIWKLRSILHTPLTNAGSQDVYLRKYYDIDGFDKGVIKRCVHNFHVTNKELDP